MVRRNDFQKKGVNQGGNFQGPRNQNRQGQEYKSNNEQKNISAPKNNEPKAGTYNEQPNEAKRPAVVQGEQSNELRKQVGSEKEHKEQREHREQREYREHRDGQQRNNYNRSYSANSRYAGKIKAEETVEDIIADITRIEKEIDLEIKEISSMRLGL